MCAIFGTALILVAYLTAGAMGYGLGYDAGIRHEKTKRGIHRG